MESVEMESMMQGLMTTRKEKMESMMQGLMTTRKEKKTTVRVGEIWMRPRTRVHIMP
jgi:hypothetical protein